MKAIIKLILRRLGYDLVRYQAFPSVSWNPLPLLIGEWATRQPNLQLVQIGANDGGPTDPLRHAILKHQITSLLIEPLPDIFERLNQNYAGVDHVRLAQYAVGPTDGTLILWRVKPDSNLPSWTRELASFDRNHFAKFPIPNWRDQIEPIEVPMTSPTTLITRHELNAIDCLVIDTEGFDAKIVHAFLDSGIQPLLLVYEFFHVPIAERISLRRRLFDLGYLTLDVGRDTQAVHPSLAELIL